MNLTIFLSIPKTIYFNLRYLPFRQAKKLPIWVTYNSKIKIGGGKNIQIKGKAETAMIRIGFHKVPVCNPADKTVLNIAKGGCVIFEGSAHIGNGTKIHVSDTGILVFGDNFAVSASSQINCYKRIRFGRNIQFSWDCLCMDSDTHCIYNEQKEQINEPREIIFGNKIWIGCRTTILKGTVIPNDCVIGAGSLVSGRKFEHNTIIAGHPAKSIKKISGWDL